MRAHGRTGRSSWLDRPFWTAPLPDGRLVELELPPALDRKNRHYALVPERGRPSVSVDRLWCAGSVRTRFNRTLAIDRPFRFDR